MVYHRAVAVNCFGCRPALLPAHLEVDEMRFRSRGKSTGWHKERHAGLHALQPPATVVGEPTADGSDDRAVGRRRRRGRGVVVMVVLVVVRRHRGSNVTFTIEIVVIEPDQVENPREK